MERLKKFFVSNFEAVIVVILLASIATTHFFVPDKFPFLNFYYLPILISGYFLGRNKAILTAVASILMVFLYSSTMAGWRDGVDPFGFFSGLVVWGAFLLLAATLVGTLYEQKEEKVKELKLAYVGVLEILAKYLEAGDQDTKTHSMRVAEHCIKIAAEMGLDADNIENIRAAALLHDIGKIEIGVDLINKSVNLSESERFLVNTHVERGAKLIEMVGGVLKAAVPLVVAHHDFYVDHNGKKDIPLGARILAVADSFDAMISDRPYRAGKEPWQALLELEKGSGFQFDPDVVTAFKTVLARESSVLN